MARWCYMANLIGNQEPKLSNHKMLSEAILETCQIINLTLLNIRENNKQRSKPRSNLEEAWIYGDDNKQAICIEVDLTIVDKAQLIQLMKKYKEIFTQTLANMSRININVACHKLSIKLVIKLVQQKLKIKIMGSYDKRQ